MPRICYSIFCIGKENIKEILFMIIVNRIDYTIKKRKSQNKNMELKTFGINTNTSLTLLA